MLPALIVGGLTAWYLGLRAGVVAAIVTFAALLISAFVPGLTIAVYALVLAWSAALYFLGAKMSKGAKPGAAFGGGAGAAGAAGAMAKGLASQASAWFKKVTGSDSSK